MKTSAHQSSNIKRKLPIYRRPWFYVALVIIVAVIVFGVWFIFFRKPAAQEVQTPADSTIGSVPSSIDAKGEDAEKEDENAETGKKQTPAQYDGEDPNTLDELTGYISYDAINYDHYSIRMTINQFLTSGTCDLTMTSGDRTVTGSAPIIASASTSTCEGFDIPLSELPSGDWHVTIKLSSDGKQGAITGDVSV